MIKKITLTMLLCVSALINAQTTILHDFEAGSPAVDPLFGANFSTIANPDLTDNTSANVGQIGRDAGATQWFHLINFELSTPYVVPANTQQYIHILVKAPSQTDIGIRVDGTAASKTAGTVFRAANDYTDLTKWQDMVFSVSGGASGKTISYITFHADMGFQNTPSGQILNNTDSFLLIDNIKINSSATSELQNTWLGTTSDWSNASNWSRGLPSNNLGILIPTGVTEPVVADGTGIETNYMNIASGTAINIGNGSSLIVNLESTSPAGSIKYSRTLTADSDPLKAWHLIASPIGGQRVSNFIAANSLAIGSTNTNLRGIGKYTNDGSGWTYYESNFSGADGFFGEGYAVKNAAAGDVVFTGNFRKLDRNFSISQGTTNNFNLIGNPYLAYVNLGTFLTENNAITDRLTEATIWLWDQSANAGNGGYITKMLGTDAAFEISPGQAFFVSAGPAASNVAAFSESNQSHKTDTFLKENTKRTEINLFVSQDDLVSSTKLYYLANASTGFDNGFDGSMFTGIDSNLSIYTNLVSGDIQRKIATQSLPNENYEDMVVPVGLKATKGREITISATSLNLPKGMNVFLEDRQTNSITNLNNDNYKVTLSEDANGSGRFFLRTSANGVLSADDINLSGVNIFKSGHRNLRITGLQQTNATLSVFNVLGKQVMVQKFTASNDLNFVLPNLAKGVYIVKLDTNDGSLNKKIILE